MTEVRVAVTTSADRYHRLARSLEELDLVPVMLPCIEVIPAAEATLSHARDTASRADWLLVTSARTIDALWPEGGMPEVRVAAVGLATAEGVSHAGGTAEVVGHGGAGELVSRLGDEVAGQAVFLPHALGADPATVLALRGLGARVTTATVYEVRPVPAGDDPVGAAIFGSPSAVAGWFLSRDVDGMVVGAIGETTATALAMRGRPPDVVPTQPSFDRLVRSMADHLRDRSPI